MVDVTLSLIGANGDEIVFSDEGDFVLTSGLAGLGIPATQVRIDDSASDGGVWRFSKRGVRELDLPVVVFGADRVAVEANLRRLNLLLNDRDGGVVLQAAYSSGEVWHLTQGHYVAGASGVRGDDGGLAWERWVLSLQFANPFWVSQASESFAVGAPSSTGSFLPNLAELVVSSAQAVGSVTVENPGDVDAFPVWSLRGPADSVTISNGSESFVYNAPILASSTVVVDTATGTVTDQLGVNKYGSLGVSPSLFALPSGSSQVSVTATNASAGSWTEVETLATNLVTNPSMEASSGSSAIRTNLVTNPSMEAVSTGAVVMRRNLVTNPSFETNTTGWSAFAPATLSRVTTDFFIGSAALQVATAGLNAGATAGVLSLSPSTAYTFSVYVKGEIGKTVYLELLEQDSAGAEIGRNATAHISMTGAWQRLTVSRNFSTGVRADVRVRNGAGSANHTFQIDAVMLEASSVAGDFFDGSTTDALGWDYAWSGTANASISTAACAATTVRTNLITNPSFEANTTGWTANGATATRVTTEAVRGTASAQVAVTSVYGNIFSDKFPITASATYTASGYIKAAAGVTVEFRLFEYDSSNASIGTNTFVAVNGNGAWQRVSVTRTMLSNGATAAIRIAGTAAGVTFYADGVLLELGSTVGDFFDGSFSPAGDFSYAWTGTANASTSIQRGATVASWAGNGISTQSRSEKYVGSASIQTVATATGYTYFRSNISPSVTYTASAWVKGEAGKDVVPSLVEYTSGMSYLGETNPANVTLTGSWQRISVTRTLGATAGIIDFRVRNIGAQTFYVDAAVIEASPIVQDYFDGSVVSADADLTNSWSGTAHASTSLMRGVGVASSTQGVGAASIQSTGWSSTGTKSIRIIPTTTGNNSWVRFDIPTTVGATYTVMGKLRQTQALTGSQWANGRRINAYNSAITSVVGQSAQATNAAGVYSHSVTFVAASTTTPILLGNGASAGNGDVWWDDLIVVAGSYTGDYFDGNSTTLRENGYTWTGTANASTSTWKRREIQGATLISCNYQPRKEIVH